MDTRGPIEDDFPWHIAILPREVRVQDPECFSNARILRILANRMVLTGLHMRKLSRAVSSRGAHAWTGRDGFTAGTTAYGGPGTVKYFVGVII